MKLFFAVIKIYHILYFQIMQKQKCCLSKDFVISFRLIHWFLIRSVTCETLHPAAIAKQIYQHINNASTILTANKKKAWVINCERFHSSNTSHACIGLEWRVNELGKTLPLILIFFSAATWAYLAICNLVSTHFKSCNSRYTINWN